jgi:uncharacterized protein DUF4124
MAFCQRREEGVSMKRHSSASFVLLAFAWGLVTGPSALADIYRYKDATGKWVISNTPPPNGTTSTTQTNENQFQNAPPSPPTTRTKENQFQNTPSSPPVTKQNKKEEIIKTLAALNTLTGRWKDAMQLATVTARIALAGPVNNLQAIKQETETLLVPDCLIEPKQALVEAMDRMIKNFLQFMHDKSVSNSAFRKGIKSFAEYEEGAKLCTP